MQSLYNLPITYSSLVLTYTLTHSLSHPLSHSLTSTSINSDTHIIYSILNYPLPQWLLTRHPHPSTMLSSSASQDLTSRAPTPKHQIYTPAHPGNCPARHALPHFAKAGSPSPRPKPQTPSLSLPLLRPTALASPASPTTSGPTWS